MYVCLCIYSVNSNKAPLVENLFKLSGNVFHLLLGHFDAMNMERGENWENEKKNCKTELTYSDIRHKYGANQKHTES